MSHAQRVYAPGDLGAAIDGLRELVLAGEVFRRALAAQAQLSATEILALTRLARTESTTARDLAAHLALTPSTVTSVIDRLELAGLVRRAPHPRDRRQILIVATAHGRSMLEWISGWVHSAVAAGIRPEDWQPAGETMTELAGSLRAHAQQIAADFTP